MKIQSVGIIGAGTMGNGIAQVCAVAGLDVVMVDINDAAVERGIAQISSARFKPKQIYWHAFFQPTSFNGFG